MSEKFVLKRKFSSSFGSIKTDKTSQQPLSFAEMKRTAVHVFTINGISLAISCLGDALKDQGALTHRILTFLGRLMAEASQAPPQRKQAYMVPFQRLMNVLAEHQFDRLLEFLNSNIAEISGSSRFELFVKSLESVKLCLYPATELDTSLNFLETLASYYVEAKGVELREAFANTLCAMLVPLIDLVTAEVNLPKWEKIFSKILLSRVIMLCEKPKYRAVTLELAVVVLCLCNKEIFLERWLGLAEAIASLLKDGQTPSHHVLSILRLLWVYCSRYRESFATQMTNLQRILNVFVPPGSKRTAVAVPHVQTLYYGLAMILGPAQLQSLLRDIILPLMEGFQGSALDNFPAGKCVVAIKTLLYAASLSGKKPILPTQGSLKTASESYIGFLCDQYVHFKADCVSRESLDRVRTALGKIILYLDELVWDEPTYDLRQNGSRAHSTAAEIATIKCFTICLEVLPYVNPLMSRALSATELLIKYCTHAEEELAEVAFRSLQTLFKNGNMDGAEIVKFFWLFAGRFDRIPDRCSCAMSNIAKLCPLLVEILIEHTMEENVASKDIYPMLGELAAKLLILALNHTTSIRELIFDTFYTLERYLQDLVDSGDVHQVMDEIRRLVDITRRHFAHECFTHHGIVAGFLQEVAQSCPTIVGIAKASIMHRVQEIQSQLNGKSQYVEDQLVIQWSYYLSAILRFGAPDSNSSTLNKRLDGMRLRRLLSFTRSSSNLLTMKSFLCQMMVNISTDNDFVCECLCEAVSCIDPAFLPDLFDSLEPYFQLVSEDYRNIKYQVVRKNRKQDLLKVDLTRLLSRVATITSRHPQGDDPQFGPHVCIKRYIIEAYYFVSEIDVEENLPGLRYTLAELVRNYHTTIINLHPRYEFFPFKLQIELFQIFRRWYEEKRYGTMTQGNPDSAEKLDGTSSLNSASMLTFKMSTQDVEKAYAECLASLCHGLLSPLPIYRNESIPSSQVLRWVDSLIACHPWGPGLIQVAVRNILTSNRTILEKVVQKIFQADVVCKYPELSDAYFLAVCEALVEGKVDLPTYSILVLLSFKNIQGAPSVKRRCQQVALQWFCSEEKGALEGRDIISLLPDRLCMLAGQVVSEIVLRVEYLLSTNLEASIKNLLCQWLRRLVVIPGQTASKTSLLNVALLSIRYLQKGCLEESFPLWDALVLWKHHVNEIIELWSELILRHRNTQLLEVSSRILIYLMGKGELRPVLVGCIVHRLDPATSLLPDTDFSKSHRENEDLDYFSSSRLETILQTSEKSSLPLDYTFGQIAVKWICDFYRAGFVGIIERPQVKHLWRILKCTAYPMTEEQLRAVPVAEGGTAEVAIQWALGCPIKALSFTSWKSLGQQINQLSDEEVSTIIPLVASYVHWLVRRPEKRYEEGGAGRIRTGDLMQQAIECLLDISDEMLRVDAVNEALIDFATRMLDSEEERVFAASLRLLLRTPPKAIDVERIVRGYASADSFDIVCAVICNQITSLYQRGGGQGDRITGLLAGLAPAMIKSGLHGDTAQAKHLIEAASMVCNLLEDENAGSMGMRCLQCFGRKRRGGDSTRELACIYADPLFVRHSQLLAAALAYSLQGSHGGAFVAEMARFLALWTQMAGDGMEREGRMEAESWSRLGETMVAACSQVEASCDHGALVEGVDAILRLAERSGEGHRTATTGAETRLSHQPTAS